MVALPDENRHMTEAEYLEFERNSEIKHEYINGEVIAMTGASWEHNMICSSIIASLLPQLRSKSCKISPSDLRLKIPETNLYTYPDISVICGEPKFAGNEFDTIVNPIVIIEILSKSTEAYDRGKKFQHYRQIETLQDYLLIAQDKPHIEGFTKQDDGKWALSEAIGLTSTFAIPSIVSTLALADVYENVTFPDKDSTKEEDSETS